MKPHDPHETASARPFLAPRAVLLIALALVAGGCEPRLPVSYLRASLAPDGMQSLGDLDRPDERPLTLLDDVPPPVDVGWDSIVARDTIRALFTFNSTGYFIYRGDPMGFEYELLLAFAEAHDLELGTQVVRERSRLFRMLNRGEGDVVAARLVAAPEYRQVVSLTAPLYATRPVIVQRAVDNDTAGPGDAEVATRPDTAAAPADTVRADPLGLPDSGSVELRARVLRRPAELGGESIHVSAASDYYSRIVELSDSIGRAIEIVEVQNADQVEPLIQAVAEGRIQLTVSPANVAELSQERFANIIVTPAVGPPQAVVWAVRRNAPELREKLDQWLRSEEGEYLVAVLYRKYYVDRKSYLERVEDELLAHETGQISPYDSLLAREVRGLGWDWRLLAAQVAQESRFDPRARSWAGATGLLQLMPRTAREMGVRNPTDPAESVAGGVRYLQWLSELWADEVPDEEERLKFVLASYNAGRGHVLDAQRLAEKHGDDPMRWDDVAYWLLQKSKASVYRDPVVRHGYVRGLEPVQYVSKILQRYEIYRSVDQENDR